MFLVTDLTIEPEPEDLERGHVDQETVVHLKVEDALEDLGKRIRFSLGYEANPDLERLEEDPPLRAEDVSLIEMWTSSQRWNAKIQLRIDTRDYQHLLIPLGRVS